MPESLTARRKDAHLDLCLEEEVEPRDNDSLLQCVKLVHCAVPELALDEIDTSTPFFGKTLKYPLIITGMTGGTDRAARINGDLAAAAEKYGIAFGVGSQRAMSEDSSRAVSFQVRKYAPKTVIVGNVGLRTAASLGEAGVRRLMDSIEADALALHLNAGQELTQPEGDRDFRQGYATIAALAQALKGKLLVKETGCGIGPKVAMRLRELGVSCIDVSGLGGTSWIRVEQLRNDSSAYEVGAALSDWGIPTAAAIASVRRALGDSGQLIASGGIRTGVDVAKCLALGADLAGMALPLFKAQQAAGMQGVERVLDAVLGGLRQALLLTGSRSVAELHTREKVITGELKDWLSAL